MPLRKVREGKPLPDTEEMKVWRKQYMEMSFEEHKAKLMELGLSEEEIEEFREVWMKEKKEFKGK
jgi:hypothetical protein